jgi:hypothetical protein
MEYIWIIILIYLVYNFFRNINEKKELKKNFEELSQFINLGLHKYSIKDITLRFYKFFPLRGSFNYNLYFFDDFIIITNNIFNHSILITREYKIQVNDLEIPIDLFDQIIYPTKIITYSSGTINIKGLRDKAKLNLNMETLKKERIIKEICQLYTHWV